MTPALAHPAAAPSRSPAGAARPDAARVWPAALGTVIERAKALIARAIGVPAACPGRDGWIV